MKGIRNKVLVGFLCIILLLVFSGIMSLFELNRLSRDAEIIFTASQRNAELSKEMFDAAQDQRNSVMNMIAFSDNKYKEAYEQSTERLKAAIIEAQNESVTDDNALDSLIVASDAINFVVNEFLTKPKELIVFDNEANMIWYRDTYEAKYQILTNAIKEYMTSLKGTLTPRIGLIQKNAARAVKPVFVTVVVTILIVLMFLYFFIVYGVNPILKINRSLRDYIKFKQPFVVKGECNDELGEIKNSIDVLINVSKQKRMEQDKL